jgi:hypothetical protein
VIRLLCGDEPASAEAAGRRTVLDLRADRPEDVAAYVRGLP